MQNKRASGLALDFQEGPKMYLRVNMSVCPIFIHPSMTENVIMVWEEVLSVHNLGTMNVCIRFHEQTNIAIPRTTPLLARLKIWVKCLICSKYINCPVTTEQTLISLDNGHPLANLADLTYLKINILFCLHNEHCYSQLGSHHQCWKRTKARLGKQMYTLLYQFIYSLRNVAVGDEQTHLATDVPGRVSWSPVI